jgi:hypothetical protein
MIYSGLCKLCGGFKNLFCIQNGRMRWFTCPSCSGAGTVNQARGPAEIRTHAR